MRRPRARSIVSATAAIALVLSLGGATRALVGPGVIPGPSAFGQTGLVQPRTAQPSPLPAAPTAAPTPPATTERDSVGTGNVQADGVSGGVTAILPGAKPDEAISADGRWVAFASAATSLGAGATNPGLFLHDRQAGTTSAIPWLDGGALPVGVTAAEPAVSGDGSVVAFTAILAANVTSGSLSASQPTPYVLAWDRSTNATTVVSLDAFGRPTPGWQPSISADGHYVAYTTWAFPTPSVTAPPSAPPTAAPTPTPTPPPDLTAPTISNIGASPTAIGCTGSATITARVSDPDDSIGGVSFWFRLGSGTTYGPYAMTYHLGFFPDPGHWAGTIKDPGWGFTSGTVIYYLIARDSNGNSSGPTFPSSAANITYQCIG